MCMNENVNDCQIILLHFTYSFVLSLLPRGNLILWDSSSNLWNQNLESGSRLQSGQQMLPMSCLRTKEQRRGSSWTACSHSRFPWKATIRGRLKNRCGTSGCLLRSHRDTSTSALRWPAWLEPRPRVPGPEPAAQQPKGSATRNYTNQSKW
jgi:hypothetical protein